MINGKIHIPESKKGSSLIELMVSMLISSIMLMMVVATVGPVGKLIMRMQQTQLAQGIISNAAVELQSQVSDAVEYVKIYASGNEGDIVGAGSGVTGTTEGTALEYKNTQGYIEVLSTDGCAETTIIRGETITGQADAEAAGRLVNRYYVPIEPTAGTVYYEFKEDGTYIARAVGDVFPDKYYMDYYMKVTFSYPGGVGVNDSLVRYVNAKIELYKDAAMTELVAYDNTVLDFRYDIKTKQAGTGMYAENIPD